jgi:maleate cis-trans isomerase
MYGWRARIGHLNPSPATVGSEEWRKAAPQGVAFVGSRYTLDRNDRAGHDQMLIELERAAREVASAGVDVIIQCSTLAALGREAEIRQRIETATGVPALTVLGSIVQALHAEGSHRIALGTPYTEAQNLALAEFLNSEGFEVVASKGLNKERSIEFGAEEPHVFYRLGKQTARLAPQADTLLLTCGNTRTFEILEALEWDTGLKVISSNQAALWNSLRVAGVGEPIKGFGRLLASEDRLK